MYKNTFCFFLCSHVSEIIHTNLFRKLEGDKKKKIKAHSIVFMIRPSTQCTSLW